MPDRTSTSRAQLDTRHGHTKEVPIDASAGNAKLQTTSGFAGAAARTRFRKAAAKHAQTTRMEALEARAERTAREKRKAEALQAAAVRAARDAKEAEERRARLAQERRQARQRREAELKARLREVFDRYTRKHARRVRADPVRLLLFSPTPSDHLLPLAMTRAFCATLRPSDIDSLSLASVCTTNHHAQVRHGRFRRHIHL